jgi:hypothetical protein
MRQAEQGKAQKGGSRKRQRRFLLKNSNSSNYLLTNSQEPNRDRAALRNRTGESNTDI